MMMILFSGNFGKHIIDSKRQFWEMANENSGMKCFNVLNCYTSSIYVVPVLICQCTFFIIIICYVYFNQHCFILTITNFCFYLSGFSHHTGYYSAAAPTSSHHVQQTSYIAMVICALVVKFYLV